MKKIVNSIATEIENSSKKTSEKNDFSLKFSDFEKFDNSIIAKNMKKTTTKNRREIATKNRREITTKNCIDVEKNKFETFARFFDRIFETTNDCIEIKIVISIEKIEFEIFAIFFDRIIIIKKTTLKLNDILIEIRMNFRFTNENFEMKNRNFTRKMQKKITIFMKIHLFFRLNIKKFRNVRMFFFRLLKISKKNFEFSSNRRFHIQNRKNKRNFSHINEIFIFFR